MKLETQMGIVLLSCFIALSSCARPSSLITEVEINTDFNLIFAPLKFNNETNWFIIDTGAPSTYIDEDLAKEWGLKIGETRPRNQVNGVVQEASVDGFEFEIGGHRIRMDRANTAPMKRDGFTGFMGKDFGGILGYDFIREFVFEVDYQRNLLRIHDKDLYEYGGMGTVIDARITRTRPLINGTIIESGKRVPVTWLLDTGSLMFLSINGPFAQRNDIAQHLNTIPALSVGAGGTGDAVMYKLDGVELAGMKFKSPISGHSSSTISRLFEGVVGGEFLHRFRVILDYERDRVILEPNTRLDDPIRFDLSGMMLRAEGANYESVEVLFVFDESPADEAGILPGDVLQTVNGELASELTLPYIWRRFREREGDVFDLEIDRGGKRIEKRIVLKDFFK